MVTNENDYLQGLVIISESILAYSRTLTWQAGAHQRYFWAALYVLDDDSRYEKENARTSKETLPRDSRMKCEYPREYVYLNSKRIREIVHTIL